MVFFPKWPKIDLWKNNHPRQNLTRCYQILAELTNPQDRLPPTIHIAGTNGKGSTLAMIEAIFNQAGYVSHKYSSPHILEFNERIKLRGQNISDSHLEEILAQTKRVCELLKIQPDFFEGTSLAAFLAFAAIKADILLLETGLGGRIDPTNVVTKPLLTIITPISYDHMEHLGSTLSEIAQEKAGIIKPGVPCVIAQQRPELYDLFLAKCDEVGAPAFCYQYDFISEVGTNYFKFISKNIKTTLPLPALLGKHQLINASTALAAVFLLNQKFKINQQQIKAGLANIYWPGRLEKIAPSIVKKLVRPNNIDIFLDGAHNEAGAKILAEWLQEQKYQEVYLILGLTNNRDIGAFCQHFKNHLTEIITVTVKAEPSSYHAKTLKEKISQKYFKVSAANSLPCAIENIASRTNISQTNQDSKKLILITGSLFLLTDFYKIFES